MLSTWVSGNTPVIRRPSVRTTLVGKGRMES